VSVLSLSGQVVFFRKKMQAIRTHDFEFTLCCAVIIRGAYNELW
jgi:hypothetical protein